MTDNTTARVTADDIPTSVTKLTYRRTQELASAGLPVLSQNQTAELLAHFWPAIEQHFRSQHFTEGYELITSASRARLDAIDEDDRRPSDWERHQQWCDAADVLTAAHSAGRPKRERPLVLCELPHPIAPDTWCALPIEHDGWHQDEAGDRWPNLLLAARTTTAQEQQ
jgi:hypothetical protein